MHQIHSRLDPAHHNTYAAFASGEGITSLLSVVKAVLEGEPTSRMLAFYAARDLAQFPQVEQLQELKDSHLQRLSLYFFFSDESQEIELFNGRLDAAKIAALANVLFDPEAIDDFYLCGPQELNHATAEALKVLQVNPAHIHGDRAAGEKPATEKAAAAPKAAAQANITEVTVLLDGRRRSFSMPMDGSETVLEAAERCGLDLPFSCRAAVCSTCRTRVVKGSVEMAQNYALEAYEVDEGYILACQSRPTTPELELDYDDK